LSLSGSRGVMRADDHASFCVAFKRLRALLRTPDVQGERNAAHSTILIEGFIPGREYAIEGLMHHGELHLLAIFDKPDPLDGPFFEETVYLTPPAASDVEQRSIADAIRSAARGIGLHHGPIHAECRVNARGVFVLEVAARPIGGICARSLRFERPGDGSEVSLEEVLLRHCLGESPSWRRVGNSSGVMMIPIPRGGIYRRVTGIEAAARVEHVTDIKITAKPDQRLVPLPEGASYLGFIFARGARRDDVDRALRLAHQCLTFHIDAEFPILAPSQIQYNRSNG